jgi:hypothetical protein
MKPVSECTRDELRAEAKEREIVGRGKMNKDQLIEAITWARAGDDVSIAEALPPVTRELIEPTMPQIDDVVRHLYGTEPVRSQAGKMSTARRRSAYMRQNGSTKLTPRQERQIRRMERRGALAT